jgi:hypothetical protein
MFVTCNGHTWTSLWSRVLHEKLIVTQLVRNSPPFTEPKGSLLCSQGPTTGPYPEPDESSPQFPTLCS